MPILKSGFKGNRIFKGAHIETAVPPLFRKLSLAYQRERLELPDGDFIDLDWIYKNNSRLMILFHGLEGSSQSQYIKGFAKYFGARGYDICAVNFRSCSGELNRTLGSYHNGSTSDIHEVITHITKGDFYNSLYVAGFSLGGNVLLKYLGDGKHKLDKRLLKAAAFSVPIDLEACSKHLARFSNKVYMMRFLSSLNKKLIEKNKIYPGQLNLDKLESITSFEEWDSRFTAPMHGFKDAHDYYRQCQSKQFISAIQIPVLLVNALNDPFLPGSCFLKTESETGNYVFFEAPERGGHAGFSHDWPNGNYYSEERTECFFNEIY